MTRSDLPGRHADLMISPEDLESISEKLTQNNFYFSTMINNVAGNLKTLNQLCALGFFAAETQAEKPCHDVFLHTASEHRMWVTAVSFSGS